jgi:predicted DNA-binding transcriptional regulator AlpA
MKTPSLQGEKASKPGPTSQKYMGMSEVAEYRGFTRQAVLNRFNRKTLPAPVAHLRMGPIWETADIVSYFRARDPLLAALQAQEKTHG